MENITLEQYQNRREKQWEKWWHRAGKPISYGTVSADAIIKRYKKYEKEYYQNETRLHGCNSLKKAKLRKSRS